MTGYSAIEPLETRIAPAVTVFHPIPDLVAGIGKTSASIDLEAMVDPDGSYRTMVRFETNFTLPGQTTPAVIEMELFDDKAPLTVQNFVSYLNSDSYDGTFFHRIFDFGAGSDTGTDIIQAGGFDVTNLATHIPTGPTLHNEYNPNDGEVQNTRGTIAMAKTAISPHTATSEWFINLTNNSSILGPENNGGFTVFGKVTDASLAVIDAIGQAAKVNRGGALTDLPVQNYPAGATSVPTPEQLIQIEKAEIIPAAASEGDGHSFVVKSINVPGTSTPSDLIASSQIDPSTNTLNLTYAAGKTGKAEVTVTVTKNGESFDETFLVTVQPNLIVDVPSHDLSRDFVISDEGTAQVVLTNNAGGTAKGNVNVSLYLSEVIFAGNNPAPETFTVDENDILLSTRIVDLDVASGGSLTVPMSYTIPWNVGEQFLIHGKQYVVVAEVDSDIGAEGPAGDEVQELFADDNSAARQTGHFFNLAFGKVGDRTKLPLTLPVEGGSPITFLLKGNGTGVVEVNDDGTYSLNITGTDAKSALSIKTARDITQEIQDISIQNTIGSVKLPNVHLMGDFSASGGAKSIVFGDLGILEGDGVDRVFSINAFPIPTQKLSLTFGKVHDYSLGSGMPIGKLTASEWLNDDVHTGADEIFAPGLDFLKIGGNLEASVLVTGEGKVRQILIAKDLVNSTIKTSGDIGVVKLRNIEGSTILAGLDAKPDSLADFSGGGTIGVVNIQGTFSASLIAAAKINSIVVGEVNTAAGFETGGFYADAIKSYVRKGSDPARFARMDDLTPETPAPTTYDASEKYEIALF